MGLTVGITLIVFFWKNVYYHIVGEYSCEDGFKLCMHIDHGDICIPKEELCSRSRRSATTCPNGQIIDPNGNCVDDIPHRQGMSAVHQPGLFIGSRPCRSECTCEDNEKGDNEGLSWCSFGTPYNWGWCDHPHPKKRQSGSRPCVFPFKYNGVMYNECTDVQWRNKWCATATNRKDEYVGAWGDCEIRESV